MEWRVGCQVESGLVSGEEQREMQREEQRGVAAKATGSLADLLGRSYSVTGAIHAH